MISQIFSTLLLLGIAVLFFQPINGDYLNEYLADKVFGPNPGPCPNFGDCDIDVSDPDKLNPAIANKNICAVNDLCVSKCPEPNSDRCCGENFTACAPLKEWVRGGLVRIWNLQCQDVQIHNLQVNNLNGATENSNKLTTRFRANGLDQRCTGEIRLEGLLFGKKTTADWHDDFDFNFDVTGTTKLTTDYGVDASLDIKADWTTNPNPNIISHPNSNTFAPFAQQLPQSLIMRKDDCRIFIGDGIDIFPHYDQLYNIFKNLRLCIPLLCTGFLCTSNGCIEFTNLPQRNQDDIIELIERIVEASIGDIMCDYIAQATKTSPFTGQNGIVNQQLDEFVAFIEDLKGSPDDIEKLDCDPLNNKDPVQCPGTPVAFTPHPGFFVSQDDLDRSIGFQTNDPTKFISAGINYWLSTPDPDNGNEPTIIGVIDRLTGNTDGRYTFDAGANNVYLKTTIPMLLFNLTIKLNSFTVKDINTIRDFEFLGNSYDSNTPPGHRRNYTLRHFIDLEKFEFLVDVDIMLSQGDWVTSSHCGRLPNVNPSCVAQDIYTFSASFGWSFDDVIFELYTWAIFQPERLDDTKLWQFFNRNTEGLLEMFKRAAKCLEPALWVPFISLSISGDGDSASTLGPIYRTDWEEFITTFFDIFSSVFTLLMKNNVAPAILQGWVRTQINSFIRDEFDAQLKCLNIIDCVGKNCDVIFSAPYEIKTSYLSSIDDAVINALLQALLEYYSETIDLFPFEAKTDITGEIIKGHWVSKPKSLELIRLDSYREAYEGVPALIEIGNLTILNLNTINQIVIENLNGSPYGISAAIGFGQLPWESIGEYLRFQVDWTIAVPFKNQFDDIKVALILQDIDIQFDIDRIYIKDFHPYNNNDLAIGQLDKIQCLFSGLDEPVDVVRTLMRAQQVFVQFEYVGYDLNDPKPSNLNDFQSSVWKLAKETSAQASEQFRTMTNSILNNTFYNILITAEKFDWRSYTAATCSEADNPFQYYVDLFTGIIAPNVTGDVAYCVADPWEEALDPFEVESVIVGLGEATSFFDFRDSYIIKRLKTAVGADKDDDEARRNIMRDIIYLLANETGTPLVDSFYLDEDDISSERMVSFRLQTNESNFLFDLFAINPLIFEDDIIIPGLNAQIETITVRGIDRLARESKLLEVLSRFVTRYKLGFTQEYPLEIILTGSVTTDRSFIDKSLDVGDDIVREDWEINTQITNLELEFELLAAINMDIFSKLTLGHFFYVTEGDQDFSWTNTATSCFYKSFFENGLQIPRFNMSIANLTGPTLTTTQNIFSNEVEVFIDQTLKLFTEFYLDALPNAAYNCFRGMINEKLKKNYIEAENKGCPKDPVITSLPEEDRLFRFGTSRGLERFNNFVYENFIKGNPDYRFWNDLMKTITTDNGQPDALFDDGSILGYKNIKLVYNDVLYGDIDLYITDLVIQDLNTFDRLELVQPYNTDVDNFTTRTAFNIRGRTKFSFLLTFDARDTFPEWPNMKNRLELEVEVNNLTLALEMFAKVDVNVALLTRFSSVLSLNEIPCLLVPIGALTLKNFDFTTSDLDVSIGCDAICDFPLFKDLQLGAVIQSSTNNQLETFFTDGIEFLIRYIGGAGLLDAPLEVAKDRCNELLGIAANLANSQQSDDFDVAIFWGFGSLGVFGCTALGVLMLRPFHKERIKQAIKEFLLSKKTLSKENEIALFRKRMMSLFQHPRTPIILKFLVPVVCLLNILGLVIAVVFSGAINVVLTFTIFGAKTNNIVLVPFTIISTINDLWNSGAWALALLIAVASCLWPIMKNVFLVFIWFSPTTILPKDKRNTYLLILDILGKWSFFDVFIVVMTLAALRTYLQLSIYSALNFIAPDAFEVDVNVTPELGIMLLCFIAASSLVVNHVISCCNQRAAFADQKEEDGIRGIILKPKKRAKHKKKIMNYQFGEVEWAGRKIIMSKKAYGVFTVVNLLSGIMVAIGVFVPLVTFKLRGIFGLPIKTIQEDLATKTYSISDLGALVSESPYLTFEERLVVSFFQLLFFATSIIFPILQVVCNQCVFILPMSLKDETVFIWIAYLVSFWAALECYILGIILTIDQIDRITIYIVDFISNEVCSNVQGVLKIVAGPESGSCLSVEGSFEPLAPLLFTGVLAQLIVTVIALQVGEAVAQNRYYQSHNGLRREMIPPKPSPVKKLCILLMTTKKTVGKRIKKKSKQASVERISSSPSVNSMNEVVRQGNSPNPLYGAGTV